MTHKTRHARMIWKFITKDISAICCPYRVIQKPDSIEPMNTKWTYLSMFPKYIIVNVKWYSFILEKHCWHFRRIRHGETRFLLDRVDTNFFQVEWPWRQFRMSASIRQRQLNIWWTTFSWMSVQIAAKAHANAFSILKRKLTITTDICVLHVHRSGNCPFSQMAH